MATPPQLQLPTLNGLPQQVVPQGKKECLICFCDIEDGDIPIKCYNPSCTAIVCSECITMHLMVSLQDKIIPKCTSPDCDTYYLYSDFQPFPHLIKDYNKCCFEEMLGKYGDVVRKDIEIKNRLQVLRDQRKVFINEKFPRAIAITASIIMPRKLRKLDKQIAEKLEQQSIRSFRICMNLSCNGSLDSNLICMTCLTQFCRTCEGVRENGHVCNDEDAQSLNVIRDMVQCPGCNLPVVKSQGCDSITCANCRTNFLYNTGEKGGHGSGTIAIKQINHDKIYLSVVYNQYLTDNGLLDIMIALESLEPRKVDSKIINSVILEYYRANKQFSDRLANRLAIAFQKYIMAVYKNRVYQSLITVVERHIKTKTLTLTHLQQTIHRLNQ